MELVCRSMNVMMKVVLQMVTVLLVSVFVVCSCKYLNKIVYVTKLGF
jgi:hypothetical protein